MGVKEPGRNRGMLTPRETEIVQLVCWGRTTPVIAEELGISPETVRTYIQNSITKAHVHSKTDLVVWALRLGLIDLFE